MSDIASDTLDIVARITPWEPPSRYTSDEVPVIETLRVHASNLAQAFYDMREQWHKAERELAEARRMIASIGAAWNHFAEILETGDAAEEMTERENELYNRVDETINAALSKEAGAAGRDSTTS